MYRDQIEHIRRFNRVVTQHVGALEDSYLQRGRPLGQARLLHEVGSDGIDVRTLRERLKSTQGTLVACCARSKLRGLSRPTLRRAMVAFDTWCLTPKGIAERATYDRLSDELACPSWRPLDLHSATDW
jgi:hypothetical protein